MTNIEVTQDLGAGWAAVMTWPAGEAIQGGPATLTVQPTGEVPIGGISTPLLRGIDFRAAADEARRQAGRGRSGHRSPYSPSHAQSAAKEISAKGITDRALVHVGAWYLNLIAAGTPRPVAAIAEDLGRSETTVRGWLTSARKKGFMTGQHGKLGGRLTPEAFEVLNKRGS